MSDAVRSGAGNYPLRSIETVVQADETLAVGIEALDWSIDSIESIVVAALLVFRLMVDRGAFDLHLPCREVALEILHVGGGVPQAPLYEREEFQRLGTSGCIAESEFLHLAMRPQRHEEQHRSLDSVPCSRNTGIAHTVAALVTVERSLARLPSGRPDGISVLYIEITSARIHRNAVVTVSRYPAELGVTVEGIAAGGIGNQGKEVLVAEVVDPGPGSGRIGDDILAEGVIIMSVFFHISVCVSMHSAPQNKQIYGFYVYL